MEIFKSHENIITPICPKAKCPHGEKYGEMSRGEKVRRNVPRRFVLTVKRPYIKKSHGEGSHGEKSRGEMSGHGFYLRKTIAGLLNPDFK